MTEPEKLQLRQVIKDLTEVYSEVDGLFGPGKADALHTLNRAQAAIASLINPLKPPKERT